MTKLSALKMAGAVLLLCGATAIAAEGQTFKTLAILQGKYGYSPDGVSLVQGRDGNFYATARLGGVDNCSGNGCGTAFRVTPSGQLSAYDFCSHSSGGSCPDGSTPLGSLALGIDGLLYGTTGGGGAYQCIGVPYGCGTVFKITPRGTLTTLYSFDQESGEGIFPDATLVASRDGNFYGTTVGNGSSPGTIFRVTPNGGLTTLHRFDGDDGSEPEGGLIQTPEGDFYGTTSTGGDAGAGTVFRMSPQGTFTTIHRFCAEPPCSDGSNPNAGLIQASDGNLYGMTPLGGIFNSSSCSITGCGTVFKISPDGVLTTLYAFCSQNNCSDGRYPMGNLVEATDGNLYGTTPQGGDSGDCISGCGTIFQLTLQGKFTTILNFGGDNGEYPYGGLLQSTNGVLYGLTQGSVYSINLGLDPFVGFVIPAGKVGQTGGILGQGFTGTTGVSFNGLPASFKVISDTFIEATVPAGASTGNVTVTTPSGTLTSNVTFRVIK